MSGSTFRCGCRLICGCWVTTAWHAHWRAAAAGVIALLRWAAMVKDPTAVEQPESGARSGSLVTRAGTRRSQPRRVWAVPALMAVTLTVRLSFEIETHTVPTLRHLIGDAAGYYRWAEKIADGEWLGDESFYQAPLYPYVLGVLLKLVGCEVGGIRLAQALWGALGVWCLCCGTARIWGWRTGVVAGAMLALYAPAIFFDGIVQKTSLGCFLVCALVAVMGWTEHAKNGHTAVLLGAVAGLLVLTRENAIVWLPLVGIWLLARKGEVAGTVSSPGDSGEELRETVDGRHGGRPLRRAGGASTGRGVGWKKAVQVGGYVLGLALVLTPVGVRNRHVGGGWSLSTFQAGPNFYIGNHRGAHGRYQPLVRGHETPAFERKDATVLAEREQGRKLSPREVSDYWMGRAIGDIRDDPLWWLGLTARKMLMVWNRYEVSDAESLEVYSDDSVTLRVLGSVWHFGVLCPLAAVGVVATRGQWRRLWIYYALIVSMALAVALFYVMARYRFPLVPLLIPFAAAGCVELWDQVRGRAFQRLLWPVVVGLVVAVVVNWPVHDEKRLNAMAWMNVGVALAQEGDVEDATHYFRKAVDGHPESAEANNNLAQALALGGDYAGAIPHYQAALVAEPALMGVDYNLAVALERVGRLDEALMHYERAVELDPSDDAARTGIARLRAERRQ